MSRERAKLNSQTGQTSVCQINLSSLKLFKTVVTFAGLSEGFSYRVPCPFEVRSPFGRSFRLLSSKEHSLQDILKGTFTFRTLLLPTALTVFFGIYTFVRIVRYQLVYSRVTQDIIQCNSPRILVVGDAC